MFDIKIKVLLTFRKTYKYNHYENVSGALGSLSLSLVL